MVLFKKVILKFQQLDEYVGILRKISKTPKETFLNELTENELYFVFDLH